MTWSIPNFQNVWFLSDLHGGSPLSYLPPVLPTEVRAVVVVGDLLDGFTIHQGTEEAWSDLATRYPGRLFFVRGNHDCDYRSRTWWTPEADLTGRVLQFEDLWIAGLGWSGAKPFQAPKPSDHQIVCQALDPMLISRPADVQLAIATHFVPNMNPWRRRDSAFSEEFPYVGYEDDALNPWIERWKPQALVLGHLHEFSGRSASWGDMLVTSSVVPHVAPKRR